MAWRINPVLNVDVYKVSHKRFTAKGTKRLYSNLTARSFKRFSKLFPEFDGKLVYFGIQFTLKKLNDDWNENFFNLPIEEVMAEIEEVFKNYIGPQDLQHFRDLHALGYLPILVKSLPEGSLVEEKIPLFTIVNTHDDYQWLVNYLETFISACIWKLITVATVSREFRKLSNRWALKTVGSIAGTEYQNHDFSFRSQPNPESAASSGAAFLTSSNGSDTPPALSWLKYYYKARLADEFIAASVNASEHSVSCLGSAVYTEFEFYKKAITEDYPTGIVSLVMDTYNYWNVLRVFLPLLKQEILDRKPDHNGLAKVVVRGDSGNPIHIIAGYHILDLSDLVLFGQTVKQVGGDYYIHNLIHAVKAGQRPYFNQLRKMNGDYSKTLSFEVVKFPDGKYYKLRDGASLLFPDEEHLLVTDFKSEMQEVEAIGTVAQLWNIFGGTITETGYKLLHERIGAIYGDSITYMRAYEIYDRLAAKGFASLNVVFGIGGFSLSYMTRDELGMAVKATMALVDEDYIELFKDPITDDGTKKSARGFLRVERELRTRYIHDPRPAEYTFVLYDRQTTEQEKQGWLQAIFYNSEFLKEVSFQEVKDTTWPQETNKGN